MKQCSTGLNFDLVLFKLFSFKADTKPNKSSEIILMLVIPVLKLRKASCAQDGCSIISSCCSGLLLC